MRSSRPVRAATSVALSALALAAAPHGVADPAPPPTVTVPRVEGLVLDGQVGEAGWSAAATLPCEAVGGVQPVVRVAVSGGRLWLAAEAPEEAGFPCGVKGFVGAEGTPTVADAIAFAYVPQDVRGPRYVARGPAGDGRGVYRLAGGADVTQAGRWTVEVALPLEDLRLADDAAPLRLAVGVALRSPNHLAAAPPGSVGAPIGSAARLLPPGGGWGAAAKVDVDAKALAAEDEADRRRLGHWQKFLEAWSAARRTGASSREVLMAPLDAAIAARPDLAVLRLAKGEVLASIGDLAAARVALQEGLAIVPQLREARWSLAQLDVAAWVEPADDQPSDYAAAFAAIAKARAGRAEDDPGTALAEAVLRYRHGDFAAATPLFERVLPRYPVGEDTTQMAEACRRYPEAMSVELGYRRRDEAANLPRARMETSKGPVVFELFEDDAPNSVANFVWLADAKFYDGLAFHRVVPFFMAQGGDPASRTAGARVGAGGPGYAIPTEPSRRLPFRGVLAYAHAKRDGEGSQFFVTTGTSANLQGDFSVFGRVVEGQDVVDRLVRGDRILTLAVVARRDHPYRPTTVAGTPAPAPVATFPPPPK